ncbi:MAG: hypothetical protein PHR35_20535, partial [Kiritimatiellae bacterium]|nr:hypothetical protein [Kiritimatiellia bacterium]
RSTLADVAWQADSPGKAALENARAGKPEKAQNLTVQAFNQAFLYLVTEDPTRRDNARALLDAWAVQHGAKHDFGDGWRDGYRFALCYDWLYNELAPATRDAMRETMAAGMNAETLHGWEHLGYLKGSVITGRPCDWGAIASGSMLMQWLAIAGEDPCASREFLAAIVDLMQYIADLGVTADGYMNAGNGYAAGDFINYGYAVRALQVHGVPLVDHPHLRALAEWLAYESIPGQYVFDNRNFSSGHHGGLAPLMLTLAARHGGTAAWLVDQGRGPDRSGAYGVPGVLWGDFSSAPVAPPDLPLARWISTMGISFSRGGWTNGSHFCLGMEPLVPGKTHADKGSFTFYSHGQSFAADPGVGFPNGEYHQTILIDGKGQHNSNGQTTIDAIPRGFLTSALADLNHLDVKPAYERHLAYTRTQPGPVEFGKLEYGRGLPFRWEVFRPMERAERYGLYVRGAVQPYVVILDDIQQDKQEHTYAWLMHGRAQGQVAGPGHVRYQSRYAGAYVQAEREARISFTNDLPAAGEYTVYVLLRKWPQLKNWFSHYVGLHVNGRATYFRPADHLDDWHWAPAGTHVLRAGKNEVAVSGGRGLWVAQAVALPGTNAPTPGRMLDSRFEGAAPAGSVVFKRGPDLNSEDWSVHRDPCARMDLHFLQPGAHELALDLWQKPRAVPLALRAGQKAVRAGFAAVLIPYDSNDPTPVWTGAGDGGATLTWGPYTDHLYANPAQNPTAGDGTVLQTDGKFALVRTRNEAVVGHILVAGTKLVFHGNALVEGDAGPLHVMNDGANCVVQTPRSGAGIRVLALGAGEAVVNHRRQSLETSHGTARLRVAALPKAWSVAVSDDGRRVTVTGDGPLPLKVQAPRAVECVVNEVGVWFSRDGFGNVYPKIELTELTHGREPLESRHVNATH